MRFKVQLEDPLQGSDPFTIFLTWCKDKAYTVEIFDNSSVF